MMKGGCLVTRHFWLLLGAQAISALGDFCETIAVGWMVYSITGSKLAMGSLFVVAWIPETIVLLFGAPLIDRLDRRRLMVLLDLLRAVAYLGPPVLAWSGHLAIWHLYALQVVAGAAGALFRPAVFAMTPSLVEAKHLVKANAIQNGVLQAMSIAGPVFAGIVVARVGSQPALVFDALTFGLSGLSILMLPRAAGRVAAPDQREVGYRQQLLAGFTFFARARPLLVLMMIAAVSNIGIMATNTIMIPFVRDVLRADSAAVGFLQSFWGVGYLISAAVMGLVSTVYRRRLMLLGAFVVQGLALASLALVGPGQLYRAGALELLFGMTSAVLGAIIAAIYQELVPDALRGRVMAVRLLIGQGGMPIGAYVGAVLAEAAGAQATFVVAGIVIAAAATIGFSVPLTRRLDAQPAIAQSG